jgi:hypothetical protein
MISQHDLDAFVERSRIAAIGEKEIESCNTGQRGGGAMNTALVPFAFDGYERY